MLWNKFDKSDPNTYPPANKPLFLAWTEDDKEMIGIAQWHNDGKGSDTEFVFRHSYWIIEYPYYCCFVETDINDKIVGYICIPEVFPTHLL